MAAGFAARASVWPALTGIRWIGERRTRHSMKRAWAFGDQDVTAPAIALLAGPIWVQCYSGQAAVRVVFGLGAA